MKEDHRYRRGGFLYFKQWMVVARASPTSTWMSVLSRCALAACATFTWLHNPCTRWCARTRGELGKWENHNLRLHHRRRRQQRNGYTTSVCLRFVRVILSV